jgi:hypothetical protein
MSFGVEQILEVKQPKFLVQDEANHHFASDNQHKVYL